MEQSRRFLRQGLSRQHRGAFKPVGLQESSDRNLSRRPPNMIKSKFRPRALSCGLAPSVGKDHQQRRHIVACREQLGKKRREAEARASNAHRLCQVGGDTRIQHLLPRPRPTLNTGLPPPKRPSSRMADRRNRPSWRPALSHDCCLCLHCSKPK